MGLVGLHLHEQDKQSLHDKNSSASQQVKKIYTNRNRMVKRSRKNITTSFRYIFRLFISQFYHKKIILTSYFQQKRINKIFKQHNVILVALKSVNLWLKKGFLFTNIFIDVLHLFRPTDEAKDDLSDNDGNDHPEARAAATYNRPFCPVGRCQILQTIK